MISDKNVEKKIIDLQREIRSLKSRLVNIERSPISLDTAQRRQSSGKRVDINSGEGYYIDADGESYLKSLSLLYQSSCGVYLSGSQTISSNGRINFDGESWDVNGEWNSGTYEFVPLTTGKYIVILYLKATSLTCTIAENYEIWINYWNTPGAAVTGFNLSKIGFWEAQAATGLIPYTYASRIVEMTAGKAYYIYLYEGFSNTFTISESFLEIYKIP